MHSLDSCALLQTVMFKKHLIYHVDQAFKYCGLCIVQWIIAAACWESSSMQVMYLEHLALESWAQKRSTRLPESAWVALNNIESKLTALSFKKNFFTLQGLYAFKNRMEPKSSRYLLSCQASQIVPSLQVMARGSIIRRIVGLLTAKHCIWCFLEQSFKTHNYTGIVTLTDKLI